MATFYLNHESELYHYGVLGMKWGVRRYQNPDGTLTANGRARLKAARSKYEQTSANFERRKKDFNEYAEITERARSDKSYKKSKEFKTKKKELYKRMGVSSWVLGLNVPLNTSAYYNERAKKKLNKVLGKKYKMLSNEALSSKIVTSLSKEGKIMYLSAVFGRRRAKEIANISEEKLAYELRKAKRERQIQRDAEWNNMMWQQYLYTHNYMHNYM